MDNSFKIRKESVEKLFPKHDLNIDILGYESPIQIAIGQMRMEQENNIYKVIKEQAVNVDKDELIKALRYDRDQYEKGYVNGYNAKASEVAREIFEEIEKYNRPPLPECEPIYVLRKSEFAELKKKYTKEK